MLHYWYILFSQLIFQESECILKIYSGLFEQILKRVIVIVILRLKGDKKKPKSRPVKAKCRKEKANVEKKKANVEKKKANVEKKKANEGKKKTNVGKKKANEGKKKANLDGEKAILIRKWHLLQVNLGAMAKIEIVIKSYAS